MSDRVDEISRLIRASLAVKERLVADRALLAQLSRLADLSIGSLRDGGKIIFAGNGGSFADAQHLSAEFTSRFLFDRPPLASLALGTNSSAITAIGNDYGYEQVFARELAAVGAPRDVFIALSTSGNSPNILAALSVARERGLPHVVFTGQSGGKMHGQYECLRVPSTETARIQECHILMGHILCELVEQALWGPTGAGA